MKEKVSEKQRTSRWAVLVRVGLAGVVFYGFLAIPQYLIPTLCVCALGAAIQTAMTGGVDDE